MTTSRGAKQVQLLRQKFKDKGFVLRVGIVLMVMVGLFPPWMVKTVAGGNIEHILYGTTMVYAFLFTGPSLHSLDQAGIDLPVLLIEWTIIALVVGGLIATSEKAEK
jgi:hypothetical protein